MSQVESKLADTVTIVGVTLVVLPVVARRVPLIRRIHYKICWKVLELMLDFSQ